MTDPLLKGLRKHNQKALEEIMEHYTPLVSTIVFNVSGGCLEKEDIEETVSDIFLTLWKNTEKIQDGKLKSYLCCIAKTRALNKLEAVGSRAILNIDDYDLEDDFSIIAETETNELSKELRKIINEIQEPDREILIRYYYYYQNLSKISSSMNLNRDTVKSKLRRTREKIKIKLMERGYTL